MLRIPAAVILAVLVGVSTRRGGSLSASGAVAAALIGFLATITGWTWAILLIAYFAATVALSRHGAARKAERTGDVVAKAGARDARQVLANGGPFLLAVFGALVAPGAAWAAMAAGSLAGSAADTWATEIGTLYGGVPRSVISGRPVEPGTSGGMTVGGTLAGVGGALFVAFLCVVVGWGAALAVAVLVAGIAGGLLDSLLGATIQARRWCDACGRSTERDVHACGTATRCVGGVSWFENDAVNFTATLAAGLLALALSP